MFERPEAGERTVIVQVNWRSPQQISDHDEFVDLANSAGADVVHSIFANRDCPDHKYFVGKGKVEEIADVIKAECIDLVLFNHELSPAQERNLEKALKCRVFDRTGLILDIFAQRARTFEGKLQVELAQLQHLSTRLIRGWTHLERQKGGIGLRGPGETQLELDRRLIRGRIKQLIQNLTKVRQQRTQSRRARQKATVPTVSLVGYTNAGKSTLFNLVTGADVLVANQLFATLDPTLRKVPLDGIGDTIFTDTVGFIRDLPHDLVDAFSATLEETRDADVLLHVVDRSDPHWRDRKQQVEAVLQQIGAEAVPMIEVYNKIDRLDDQSPRSELFEESYLKARVWLSAAQGEGIQILKDTIASVLSGGWVKGCLRLPPAQAFARALLYDMGCVKEERLDREGNWMLEIQVASERWQQLCRRVEALPNYFIENGGVHEENENGLE